MAVVGDGQAGRRAGVTPGQRRQRDATPTGPVSGGASVVWQPLAVLDDPETFAGEVMRAALAARDVTVMYRLLYQAGV
ncbi:MAG: hypothetical protein ACRDRP_20505, partial [Pseudonocardiaceae bacterium]